MCKRTPIAVLAASLILAGCISTSSHVSPVADPVAHETAEPGKAVVVFLRVGALNTHRAHAAIFDGEQYIGTLAVDTRIAYQADPGHHRFVSTSEELRFLEADLLEGKKYYVRVVPSGGVWKPNWRFEPQNGQTPEAELREWLERATPMEVNEEGRRYAENHAQAIRDELAQQLPDYLATPQDERQHLRPESGR